MTETYGIMTEKLESKSIQNCFSANTARNSTALRSHQKMLAPAQPRPSWQKHPLFFLLLTNPLTCLSLFSQQTLRITKRIRCDSCESLEHDAKVFKTDEGTPQAEGREVRGVTPSRCFLRRPVGVVPVGGRLQDHRAAGVEVRKPHAEAAEDLLGQLFLVATLQYKRALHVDDLRRVR